MAYPQAFLDLEKAIEERGKHEQMTSIVLRLLNRQCGELPETIRSQITPLTLPQLSEDLLDFTSLEDLQSWLNRTPPN